MQRRWGWLAAEGAILAAAAAVKAVAIAQLGSHPLLQPAGGLDSEWYVALASRVAAGDWTLAAAFEGGAFPVSPLYVYVLAIVLGLSGGSLVAARVVQAALGVVAIACAMRSARDWFGDPAGLIAGVLLAGAGVLTFHEIVLLQSALDPVLIAALALVYGRAIQGDRWHGVGRHRPAGGAVRAEPPERADRRGGDRRRPAGDGCCGGDSAPRCSRRRRSP